jgi:hypothetical protein
LSAITNILLLTTSSPSSQTGGGTCIGDPVPVLYGTPGNESYVSGIIAAVSKNCVGTNFSVRVDTTPAQAIITFKRHINAFIIDIKTNIKANTIHCGVVSYVRKN